MFFLFLKQMQLQSSDASPSMKIVALRALAYTLKTLGEVRLLPGANASDLLLESSVFFNLIMKLISSISICLLAGSPGIQGVF